MAVPMPTRLGNPEKSFGPSSLQLVGESGWVVTGWQIVSTGEFILGSLTLDSLPKSGVWRLPCAGV